MLVTGLLCEVAGLRLYQEADWTVTCRDQLGGEVSRWAVRRHPEKGYLLVSSSFVRRTPAIAEAAKRQLGVPRQQVALHRLVAAIGRGAELTSGTEVHHVGLNLGDNRASALVVLSRTTHRAVHDYLDGLDAAGLAAYLAAVPGSPYGVGALPDHLLAMVAADALRFEGAGPVIQAYQRLYDPDQNAAGPVHGVTAATVFKQVFDE